jgi:hypothetical protein
MVTLVAVPLIALIASVVWSGLWVRKKLKVLQAEVDILMVELDKLQWSPAPSERSHGSSPAENKRRRSGHLRVVETTSMRSS